MTQERLQEALLKGEYSNVKMDNGGAYPDYTVEIDGSNVNVSTMSRKAYVCITADIPDEVFITLNKQALQEAVNRKEIELNTLKADLERAEKGEYKLSQKF